MINLTEAEARELIELIVEWRKYGYETDKMIKAFMKSGYIKPEKSVSASNVDDLHDIIEIA